MQGYWKLQQSTTTNKGVGGELVGNQCAYSPPWLRPSTAGKTNPDSTEMWRVVSVTEHRARARYFYNIPLYQKIVPTATKNSAREYKK